MELNEMKIGETLNPVRLGIIAALLGGTMLNAYAEETNASSGLSSEQAQVTLPAIEVHASVLEDPRGPGAGYVAKRSLTGSRSEEHTSELQSLMRISYAVFCLKKKKIK